MEPNTLRDKTVAETTAYRSTTEKGVAANFGADPYLNPPKTETIKKTDDVRALIRRAAAATTGHLASRLARTQQGTD